VTNVSADTLVGNSDINLAEFSGELLVPTVLKSTNTLEGKSAELKLPE